MILDAVRESKGMAAAAREEDLLAWARRASALEGIAVCPEAGACIAVLADLLSSGRIDPDAEIVIFNTGAAQKYVELLATSLPAFDPNVDWAEFATTQ